MFHVSLFKTNQCTQHPPGYYTFAYLTVRHNFRFFITVRSHYRQTLRPNFQLIRNIICCSRRIEVEHFNSFHSKQKMVQRFAPPTSTYLFSAGQYTIMTTIAYVLQGNNQMTFVIDKLCLTVPQLRGCWSFSTRRSRILLHTTVT